MFTLKNKTVNPKGMTPQLMLGLIIAGGIYLKWGHRMVITSLNDGEHMEGSKHGDGDAADLRTSYFRSQKTAKQVADEICSALPDDYDVVLEKDHIHMEYDPKTPETKKIISPNIL